MSSLPYRQPELHAEPVDGYYDLYRLVDSHGIEQATGLDQHTAQWLAQATSLFAYATGDDLCQAAGAAEEVSKLEAADAAKERHERFASDLRDLALSMARGAT